VLLLATACSDNETRPANTKTVSVHPVAIPRSVTSSTGRIDWSRWQGWWRNTPGNTTGDCVAVKKLADYRSGGFTAGNFQTFIEDTARVEDAGSKLWFIPLHPDNLRLPLRVSAVKLDGAPSPTVSFEFPANSWTSDGWPFYPTGTELPPEPGTWRLIVTTGRDQGCFDISIPC
jgi:hypothetical protein